jgi:hypothetical protein
VVNLDSGLRKAAQTILKALGTTVTIRKITPGVYDVTTRTQTPTTVDTAVDGRLYDYTSSELNDYVLVGDRKLIIAAADLDFTPTPKEKVLIGTAVYDVILVTPIMAQDLHMTHELQLRGAA